MAKTFYTGVGGVARKVKQSYIGVNNVARKVKKGYIGVNGVARQFLSGGIPISSLAVGNIVYLNESGSLIPYLVVHQGKPSSIYDDSCNGTWLLRKNIYETRAWNSSMNNNYSASTIHSYLNSTFLSLFDSGIQAVVKQVKIPYVNGGGKSGSVATGANGLSAKIFLLSGREVGLPSHLSLSYLPDVGAKLDYFELGYSEEETIPAAQKRIAYLNGSATRWWLRDPCTQNNHSAWYVHSNGGAAYEYTSSTRTGNRPALILPSDTPINTSTNTIIT